jgi:chitinase
LNIPLRDTIGGLINIVGLFHRIATSAQRCLKALLPLAALLAAAATCSASTITLKWDPVTAPDLAGYKVYYSTTPATPFTGTGAAQGASPVQVASAPNATITGLDPGQPHYFAITAYNSGGVESPYSSTVVVPELIPPTVSLLTPASGSLATGTVSVSASASDNVGVTRLEFLVNGVLQATDTAAPYLFSWDTTALATGTYTLSARAYDAAGNVGQSGAVSVSVSNDRTAPLVSLAVPATTVYRTVLPLKATATDNVAVTRVELYANSGLLYAGNVPPFSYSWDTATLPSGVYSLSARAYDAAGNVGVSAPVAVKVSDPFTLAEAQTAMLIAAGKIVPTSAQLQRLDVAPVAEGRSIPNGVIDSSDVAVILSHLLGLALM